MESLKDRSTILKLLFIAFFVRLVTLIPPVIDVDEAWFAASGSILDAPGEFITKALDNKPPGTVWFFWIVKKISGFFTGIHAADPRPARAVYVLLTFFTGLLVGSLVRRIRKDVKDMQETKITLNNASLIAMLTYVFASAIPSPELLSTTTEGLMAPFIVLNMAVWIVALHENRALNVGELLLSGVCLGLLGLLKQTAVFFVLPSLYAAFVLHSRKKVAVASISLYFAAALAVFAIGALVVGPAEFWYWSFAYPSKMLTHIRANLFSEWSTMAINFAIFSAFLWPLIWIVASRSRFLNRWGTAVRNFLLVWIGSALLAVVIGKGLFFHYFLFLIAPLSVAFGLVMPHPRPRGLRWLAIISSLVCLVAAAVDIGPLWGTDINYYRKVGTTIQKLSQPNDAIFVWGGNALPLITGKRQPATRFLTARFAAAPYATLETKEIFRREFLANRPKLIVDLHRRGDEQFNAPPTSEPWLKNEIEKHYSPHDDPSVPWAVFYVLKQRSPAQGSGEQIAAPNAPFDLFDFETVYDSLDSIVPVHSKEFRPKEWTNAIAALKKLPNAIALEKLFRVWEGLRALVKAEPSLAADDSVQTLYAELKTAILRQISALSGDLSNSFEADAAVDSQLADSTEVWLRRQFDWRSLAVPLSIESRAWWLSVALVKFQPVAVPKAQKGYPSST